MLLKRLLITLEGEKKKEVITFMEKMYIPIWNFARLPIILLFNERLCVKHLTWGTTQLQLWPIISVL